LSNRAVSLLGKPAVAPYANPLVAGSIKGKATGSRIVRGIVQNEVLFWPEQPVWAYSPRFLALLRTWKSRFFWYHPYNPCDWEIGQQGAVLN